jgi:hypothetical protein
MSPPFIKRVVGWGCLRRLSGDILEKAISKQHRRSSTRIFCNPNALVLPLWVEGRGPAHNVEVVIGDLFATRNPLKLQAARKILSRNATSQNPPD